MNDQITQSAIIEAVVESFSANAAKLHNDKPAIREALNNQIDQSIKDKTLTAKRANNWEQKLMVNKVMRALKGLI